MKVIYYLAWLVCFASLIACEKINIPRDSESKLYHKVYLPAAVDLNRMELIHKDSNYRLTIGASYAGGLEKAPSEIPLEFKINLDSVTAYNQAYGTNYKALPISSIFYSDLKGVIPAGGVSSALKVIMINPTKGMDLFEDYLLPISIKADLPDGITINPKLSTAYYVIKSKLNLADFPDFNRGKWKIVGISSEELTGEGPNNGRGVFMLDNDYGTFWHTKWSGGEALGPHWVDIDMGETKTIHGLSVVGRSDGGRGRPEHVKLEVKNGTSDDWTLVESNIPLQNSRDSQRLFFKKPVEARYFRFTVLKTYDNTTFTFLAELNVF